MSGDHQPSYPTLEQLRDRAVAEIEREIGRFDLEKRIVLSNALDRFADEVKILPRHYDEW